MVRGHRSLEERVQCREAHNSLMQTEHMAGRSHKSLMNTEYKAGRPHELLMKIEHTAEGPNESLMKKWQGGIMNH